MAVAAHVIINDAGQLIGLDQQFCDLLQMRIDAIHGKQVLDVTAPADRAECEAAIRQLRETGTPFVITKRFMRADGSTVWVRSTVSMAIDPQGSSIVVATIEPVAEPVAKRSPAKLLEVARFLAESRRERADICDPALFAEPGWDMMLACYLAEAEGRPITATGLVYSIGHHHSIVSRWIAALMQNGVLEIETRHPSANAEKAYRLTAQTHQRLETYLDRLALP